MLPLRIGSVSPVTFPPPDEQRLREATADRIGAPGAHDDRDRSGRFLGGQGRGGAISHDDVDAEPHEIGREPGQPFEPSVPPPSLQDEVGRLHVAQLAQSLAEGRDVYRRGPRRQEPDAVNLACLLRPGGEGRNEKGEREKDNGQVRH
jgi:hypothetical protein